MKSKVFLCKKIVSNNEMDLVYSNHAIRVNDGIISEIEHENKINIHPDEQVYDFRNLILIPGFVQTHIHLCQTMFRGLADDLELLDWLKNRIFPYENAHNQKSLRISAQLGIHELQTSGTTTLLDMGTLNHQEVVFEELINSGMRGFSGNCMIDINELLPKFKKSTTDNLETSYKLASAFHNSENGKIRFGFAPRFVLSCSENLLKETKEMLKDFDGSLFHTHSSENKNEIQVVREMTGMENIEYFNSIGILSDRTILAHGIHVNESEIAMLQQSQTRISHCPSSNLKLASGIANIPRYLNEGISVSLGADGAPCNNNLNIFTEMRLAALIQKPLHGSTIMDSKTVFKLTTIEGAKALHLQNEIGSIEVGKKADFVFMDLNNPDLSLSDDDESIYSNIVYSASKANVSHVFIDGKQVVENGISKVYDAKKIFEEGKTELNKLLNRI